jgi:integrase
LRPEILEKLYIELLQDGVSIRNIHYVQSLLHRSLGDAVKRGLVGFNASHGVRLPRMVLKEMEILNESEVIRFLITAENDRRLALYHLAIKTGMRKGEILGLKWSDLDWNKGTIRVQRQVQRVTGQGMVFNPPKTISGRRSIQLGEETLQVLRKHLSQQQVERATNGERWRDFGLMFPSTIGTPQSPSNLLKDFKEMLRKAGIRMMPFHSLRHTSASLMLNHGVPTIVVSKF